ncbi:MAG TPA: phosphoribosyltransferase family protein, partial [Acidimicrobiales bacterium]|nr:phosphoribosyltransferase family protein [Acidimicrobiales bacterium]
DLDLADRDVILVEDIVDSGLTLGYLRKILMSRNPASLEVCALLVRDSDDYDEATLRYVGFRVPDDFLVGYGLDVAERFRNLTEIRVLDQGAEPTDDAGPGS